MSSTCWPHRFRSMTKNSLPAANFFGTGVSVGSSRDLRFSAEHLLLSMSHLSLLTEEVV